MTGETTKLQALTSGHAGPRESKSYSVSGKMSTKWRAQANTRVSIKSIQKRLKMYCEHSHTSMK